MAESQKAANPEDRLEYTYLKARTLRDSCISIISMLESVCLS